MVCWGATLYNNLQRHTTTCNTIQQHATLYYNIQHHTTTYNHKQQHTTIYINKKHKKQHTTTNNSIQQHHSTGVEWAGCVVCEVGRHVKLCFHEDRQAVIKPHGILQVCKSGSHVSTTTHHHTQPHTAKHSTTHSHTQPHHHATHSDSSAHEVGQAGRCP